MLGRSSLTRNGFHPENLGQNAISLIGNLCFAIFVVGVVIFTVIAATYEPADPLFHPSSKLTSFLTSPAAATFKPESTLIRTGEDFAEPVSETPLDCTAPVDCTDPEVFHLIMRTVIDHFPDIHIHRFGKPVPGDNSSSCHLAWRFRPKAAKTLAFNKDYRSFIISRSENCTLSVVGIGDYHSGGNARKRKKNAKPGSPTDLLAVNDALPIVESEGLFHQGRYLIYNGGGDRCKSMDHYLWSFMCALGEAQYLNRTLVMDLTICLSGMYTASGNDEEGKDFRFYFDFEHLKESASVIDQGQFWMDWGKWQDKNRLTLNLVEDIRVTPMKLVGVKDSLIMRKFGNVEPDNYWYRVCEGETESVVQRPWHLIWKSRRLMDIVSAIGTKMNWDFDSVHIVRGEKARNRELWPNLADDTSPNALISTLQDKIDDGRNLYIATDEPDTSFFDPLKDKYTTHFLDEYKELWDEKSDWYSETTKLNKGVPVDFDGYMRASVDTEVFLRGKKQIETFNDLTADCKDGVSTCAPTS